jgi:Gram-negative porin
MSPSRRLGQTLGIAALGLGWTSLASAEVPLGEAAGWTVSIDGRVNAFVSHVWGDNRPAGLDNLNWVGFNESNSPGQADADNKLRKTRVRSGYVPSTLGFTVRKAASDSFRITGRVEVGIQITNIDPAFIGDPTWMEPRAVFLDLAGNWGSVHAGRDMSLFPRQNLFMNYELGHGYGLGFPCSYERMFGGACGHVGFGVLWPDYRAQIGYSTPKFGDVLQISVALLDPRTVPTYNWDQTPLPRVEGDAVATFSWSERSNVKAWGNGFWQTVGTAIDSIDPATMAPVREDFSQDAYGVGGGVQGSFGPFKLGVSGYTGKGMDGFMTFTFNPIAIGQDNTLPNRSDRRFRKTSGFLAEASFTLGNTWIMGGFGKALLDRDATDAPIETLEAPPLIRSQTGISAGLFHRIDSVVLGIDYFNASYAFDARFTDPDMSGPLEPTYVDSKQTVHIVNSGVTLEW